MKYDAEKRDFSRIPDAMKQAARWVCWDETKKPVNPSTLYGAKPNDPATWGTFEQAEKQIGKPCSVAGQTGTVQGVGFMLGDGWTGIDLDGGAAHGCGQIPKETIDDFMALGTYCEYSKSGDGYHIFGFYQGETLQGNSFTWNDGTPDKYGVEIYTSRRYFAITGNVYGFSTQILDISAGLPALHEKYIGKPNREKAQQAASPSRSTVTAPTGETGDFLRANIDSILAAIDPDSPREIWWRIGAALKAEGFDVSVFDAWSARGSKYKGFRDISSVWNSFRRGSGGITGAYITQQAQLAGWRPETVTESYKPKTAAQDFNGLTVHTAKPASANQSGYPSPDAQPAQPAQAQPAPAKVPENAISALARFLSTTGNVDYRPISTGFPGLDSILNGGFDPGTMSIVVAEPGTGKTALVMQIAENMAKNGQSVMVFNLEMSEDQLIARSLSRLTAEIVGVVKDQYHNTVDPGDLGAVNGKEALYSNQWGLLPQKKRENITTALKLFGEYAGNLYIVTDPITEYGQIIEAVTAFKAQTGKTPVVIVDYLQLLFTDGRTSAVYSAKDIILGLKQKIAREMQTAVIMISATGRDKAKRGKMDLQSAFGSSFIEYSADYQFGLEKVDPEELLYKTFEKPLMLSLVKGRMNRPHSVQGFFFSGAFSFCREIDIAELRTVRKLVEKAEREQKRKALEDSQGGESETTPPKTSKKPV